MNEPQDLIYQKRDAKIEQTPGPDQYQTYNKDNQSLNFEVVENPLPFKI